MLPPASKTDIVPPEDPADPVRDHWRLTWVVGAVSQRHTVPDQHPLSSKLLSVQEALCR